jgi:quercetin dioxygenase-like cupin family protein
MLEGSLLFEPEHEQPFELKAGEITFNPAKHVHKAKNTSSSETAKVLLHDSGKGAAAGDPDTIKGAPCSANLCQPELHVI